MKAVSGGFGQAAENKVALFILMWFFIGWKLVSSFTLESKKS